MIHALNEALTTFEWNADVHEISLYKQKWFETSLKIVTGVEKNISNDYIGRDKQLIDKSCYIFPSK